MADASGGLGDMPGFLGYSSGGAFIVAIHADWPSYPGPPHPIGALFDLCQFPPGSAFRKVDEIDRCVLMVAEDYSRGLEPYSEQALHVAAWSEDLLALHEREYVIGLEPAT